MKTPWFCLSLTMICLTACGKTATENGGSENLAQRASSTQSNRGRGVLTPEEVAAILGSPITSAEGSAEDMNYKTATMSLETTIGIEVDRDPAESMIGARKATVLLGGTPEDVANLGDEAFFGAMSVLYVRKGDIVLTITPPNYQQMAAMAAYSKVTDAKMGSAEQASAMRAFGQTEEADPLQAGLKSADATQGALATIAAVSQKQGTPNEAKGRAVAQALAAKVLSKL